MIDAIVWFLIGGSLLALGGSVRSHAPIAAVFIGVSGIAQLVGMLGGLLRLHGTTDLALAYASAAPDQQQAVLNSYLDLWRVIDSHFHVGVLFSGVGFSVAAWSFFSLEGFPSWLAAGLAIPGLLGLAQFLIVALGLPFSRPLNLVGVGLGNVALNFAIAGALWHPSRTLICAVSGEADG